MSASCRGSTPAFVWDEGDNVSAEWVLELRPLEFDTESVGVMGVGYLEWCQRDNTSKRYEVNCRGMRERVKRLSRTNCALNIEGNLRRIEFDR